MSLFARVYALALLTLAAVSLSACDQVKTPGQAASQAQNSTACIKPATVVCPDGASPGGKAHGHGRAHTGGGSMAQAHRRGGHHDWQGRYEDERQSSEETSYGHGYRASSYSASVYESETSSEQVRSWGGEGHAYAGSASSAYGYAESGSASGYAGEGGYAEGHGRHHHGEGHYRLAGVDEDGFLTWPGKVEY